MPRCSILIPCYNERENDRELLSRVAAQDLSDLGLEREIIVVDDGSTDESLKIVRDFVDKHPDVPLRVIAYQPNRGKGCAVRKGIEEATGDYVIIQDADLEYHPSDYPALLKPLLFDLTEVVYGSRWLAREMPVSGGLFALGGWLENEFLRFCYRTNVSDIATGYKVFKADVLRSIVLDCVGFEFCPEVTAKLLNRRVRITEVPIRYTPRRKSEGKKIRWTDFFVGLYTILRVRAKRL